MKKVLALFLLALTAVFATMVTTQAAEGDLIDLYPYDQIDCYESASTCTQLKVGSSFWTYEYAGYRYHFVHGSSRFGHMMVDANSDGYINPTEYGALSWNGFGALMVNNTAEALVFSTNSGRTDMTTVVHRIYAYFDADGKLAMLEDQLFKYYIKNEGTVADPDWRLATEAEKTAYDAADPKPADMLVESIRMKLDATDAQGYVLEPLVNLTWRKFGTLDTDPLEDQSDIIVGNPNYVTIPAGWTVVTYSSLDRGAYTSTNLVKLLPYTMANTAYAPIEFFYESQPAVFSNTLGALDDDPAVPGVNVVVEYKGTFTMPTDITASWVDMFDAEGDLVNKTEKLSYEVDIKQGDTVLETIEYTYDSVLDTYTKSAEQTVIDTNVFGNSYIATFRVETPEGHITERNIDIVIGVMPPKFVGVANRYADEGLFVDLMEGITADDGYANDITDTVEVTYPVNFNPYNPQPGTYKIDLEFTHEVMIEGIDPVAAMTIGTVNITWDMKKNLPNAINTYGDYMVFTDAAVFKAAGTGYGSVMLYIGPDMKVKQWYDRYNWNHMTSTGVVVGSEALFNTWRNTLVIEEGGFVLAMHGSVKTAGLRNLPYDTAVVATIGVDDEYFYLTKNATYNITIDDVTAPLALVVNNSYKIVEGQYTNINQAILANIVGFDNYDLEDVAMYVSNNGGLNLTTPGVYTVEVTVEDAAGNATVKTFTVTVLNDDKADEIADLEGQLTDAEADLAAAEAALAAAQADITSAEDRLDDLEAAVAAAEAALAEAQEAIEALQVVPETGCGSAITGGSALFITLSLVLGAVLVVFIKKRS